MKSFIKTKSVCSGMIKLLEDFCDYKNIKSPVHHEYGFEERVPLYRWFQKLKYIDQHYHKEGVGLEIAELVDTHHIGLTAYMVSTCKNLVEYISLSPHYTILWYDFMPKHLFYNEEDVLISWDLPAYYKAGLYHRETVISEEIQVGIMFQRVFQITGLTKKDQIFSKVELAIPRPNNVDFYEEYFDCPVVFETEQTSFSMPKSVIEMTLPTYDPLLFKILAKQADTILENIPTEVSFIDSVHQAIIKSIEMQKPQIGVVADYLSMTPRALQLVLKEHQLCFKDMLNNARITLAKQYLNIENLSIVEIANLLGYKEQSSFNRIFKAKTGLSPSQWREQNIQHG